MVRSERQNREVAVRNIRIGVVEDDPASCQLVLDYLNRYQQENDEQFTVSVFDDGARIVEKYTPVYDILLLDIEMSEMDGMAAARRIRERDDKVVIVFITAAPQYAISGYEVRALSYLLKPLPWFAFSQELKKSIDMVRRNGDDSMLIETSNGQMRLNLGYSVSRIDPAYHRHPHVGRQTVDQWHAQRHGSETRRPPFLPLEFLLSGESQACDGRRRPGLRDVERRTVARKPTTQEGVPRRVDRLYGGWQVTSVILPNALAGLAGGLAGDSPSISSVLVTVLSVPPMTPITNALPDIPRSYTAICEWAACMVYIAVSYRRVPLRRSIIVSAAGLASLVAVQYFDGSMPIWFWIIGMLLAFACMYATILLGAGTGKREGLYITARAFVLAELVASLHWQIVTFIGVRDGFADYDWRAIALLVVTYALCFGLAWMVERGNFSQTTPTLPTASAAIATMAIMIVTFAMSNLSFVSTNTPFSGSVGQEIFYIRTLVDFCGFAILYAQQEQARRIEANTELASINAQLESQHQEYLQSKENIESLGRLAHDLKHQLAALRAEVDPKHAAAGFEQLEQSVQRYSAQQHTGNPVLDVILTTKERTCADRGITFTAVADGSLLSGMSSMDIASLFGNALDNAIEATSKLPKREQRLIKLALYEQNRFIVIRVENYYDSRLKKDAEGNLRTTKRDDQHRHGFGVKSIRHIAQQYGGEVTIRTEDHWFVLTALIPRKTGLMAM